MLDDVLNQTWRQPSVPEKTRLIEFGPFAAQNREKRGEGEPEALTFLGFTNYCGKRRSNRTFTVWRKTAKKRMVAKLHAIKAELRLRTLCKLQPARLSETHHNTHSLGLERALPVILRGEICGTRDARSCYG